MRTAHDDHSALCVERFDYSRIGDSWAVIRLVTRLRDEIGRLPGAATLVVDAGAGAPAGGESALRSYPARACRRERRLQLDGGGGGALLWRAAFAVPVEIAQDPGSSFSLADGGACLLCLPAPTLRTISPRSLALRPAAAPRPGALATLRSRRRATAVATVAALTTTSSPAAALASAASAGSGHHHERRRVLSAASAAAPAVASIPAQSAPATTTVSTTTTPTPTTTTTTTATTSTEATTTVASTTSTTSTTSAAATPPASSTTTTTPATPVVTTTTHGRHLPGATVVHLPAAGAARRHRHAAGRDAARRHRHPVAPSFPTASAPARPASPAARGSAQRRAERRREAAAARRIAILAAGVRQAAAHERELRHEAELAARARTRAAAAPTGSSTGVPLLGPAPGFAGPSSWTGVVSADPGLTGVVRNLSGLLSNGNRPPSFLIPIYMRAAKRYHLPWEVLAAINAIETDYGRDLNTSSAGAVGWMQFEPSTWKRYGVAVDGVSEPNPYDPRDAIFAAANYLAAAGGAQDIRRAVFAYNHAGWYVDEVMQRAEAIASHAQFETATTGRLGVISVDFATDLKRHPRVRYRSGWLSHYDRLIAAANMVSAANFPYLWGGGHEQPSRFGPFDCSGSVSYVMQQAGYRVPTTVSGNVGSWRFPAGPGQVTIFYNPVHTFMRIGNRYFGTSGFARPGGGAGWFDVDRLPASYLAGFREVHVPRLGVDSFSPNAERFLIRAQEPHRHPRPRRMVAPATSTFRALLHERGHHLVHRLAL